MAKVSQFVQKFDKKLVISVIFTTLSFFCKSMDYTFYISKIMLNVIFFDFFSKICLVDKKKTSIFAE